MIRVRMRAVEDSQVNEVTLRQKPFIDDDSPKTATASWHSIV